MQPLLWHGNVEYQTITYMVSTGSSVECVNVTAPTSTVSGVPC
ncbi:hypothetical protein ABZ924_37015 [Streptomyces sp. NPDC046876]